jgi:hypothetical protein
LIRGIAPEILYPCGTDGRKIGGTEKKRGKKIRAIIIHVMPGDRGAFAA